MVGFDRATTPRDTVEVSDEQWYWDLREKVAVPASERGAYDHFLGPYASKADAEHWQERVDKRNERWDDADEAWEHAGEDDSD